MLPRHPLAHIGAIAALSAAVSAQHSLVQLRKSHLPTPIGYSLWMSLGDLDGDGHVDAVRRRIVYRNDGHARFTPAGTLPSAHSEFAAATLADLNGDGFDDLVGWTDSGTTVWWSDGRFGFLPNPVQTFMHRGVARAVADLNGDGLDDIVLSWSRSQTLHLLMGHATRGLVDGGALDGPQGPTVVLDVDGDGDLDIIAGGTNLLRNEANTWTHDAAALSTTLEPAFAAAGDVDADGQPDLLIWTLQRAEILRNVGGAFTPAPWVLPRGTPGAAANLIDANGDGHFELVYGEPAVLHVLAGTRFLELSGAMTDGVNPGPTTVVDLDGDRTDDLLSANGLVWLGDGHGTYSFASAGPFRHRTIGGTAFAHGDFDGNGYVDLYFRQGSTAEGHLLMNRGDGTFVDAPTGAPPVLQEPGRAAVAADIDGDGDLDLLVATLRRVAGTQSDFVLRNDGAGAFGPSPIGLPPTAYETRSFAVGDLDADGDVDVVRGDPHGGLEIAINSLRGSFRSGGTIPRSGYSVDAAHLHDLDGDGALDLIACSGNLRVLPGNGDGTFRPAIYLPATATRVAIADFDDDGDADLVTGSYPFRAALLDNRGSFSFVDVSATRMPIVHDGSGTVTGDLDLDGDADVVVGTTVYENHNGVLTPTDRLLASDGGTLLYLLGEANALLDLDGDGDLDLVGYWGNLLQNLHRHAHAPYLARPGHPFVWRVHCRPGYLGAAARAVGIVGAATTTMPVPGIGTLRVDPLGAAMIGPRAIAAPDGMVDFELVVPPAPQLVGHAVHAQFVVLPPGGGIELTGLVSETIR